MTLAFLICWAPFAWIYIVKLLGVRDIESRTIYDMLPLLCVKLGCTVINPIVYVFEKTKVRLTRMNMIIIEFHFHFQYINHAYLKTKTYLQFDKDHGSSTRRLVEDPSSNQVGQSDPMIQMSNGFTKKRRKSV